MALSEQAQGVILMQCSLKSETLFCEFCLGGLDGLGRLSHLFRGFLFWFLPEALPERMLRCHAIRLPPLLKRGAESLTLAGGPSRQRTHTKEGVEEECAALS